jgi:hypothetical protein
MSRTFIAAFAAIGIVFSVYSYLARSYGDVRGEFSVAKLRGTIEAVRESEHDAGTVGLLGLVDRFNYLDGLALAIRRGPGGDDDYELGSLNELAMLVPRQLWPERPLYSFNHHVTASVWRESYFSETPIGRTGESYYVLGALGVLLGALYGWLFTVAFRSTLAPARSAFSQAFYFFVLTVLLIPDAYLTYNLKPITYLAPVILLAALLQSATRVVLPPHAAPGPR